MACLIELLLDRDRYIEYHMKQRLGRTQETEIKNLTPDEQRDMELFEVPDNLKVCLLAVYLLDVNCQGWRSERSEHPRIDDRHFRSSVANGLSTEEH